MCQGILGLKIIFLYLWEVEGLNTGFHYTEQKRLPVFLIVVSLLVGGSFPS